MMGHDQLFSKGIDTVSVKRSYRNVNVLLAVLQWCLGEKEDGVELLVGTVWVGWEVVENTLLYRSHRGLTGGR